MEIKIGDKIISEHGRPYFIADIAANHDGSLERAFRLIELAKEAGADAAKFQNFHADRIVSRYGFDNMEKLSHQASWEKSVYRVYEEASIPSDWTEQLKKKCDEVGIEYMTSAYDMESADMVEPYVNAYKIGSGDMQWTEILEYIAKKKKVMLLATGACDLEDVKRAYKLVSRYTENIVLMQCNTNYTARMENFKYINLNVLKEYKKLFPDCILGLSDHTCGSITVLGAYALGARVFEKHFTDDNSRQGPDHKFSMTPATWKEMVRQTLLLHEAMGDGIKKIEKNETESSIVQRRGLYLSRRMSAGEIIERKDMIPVRPLKEHGIPPFELEKVLGRKVNKDLDKDTMLEWEMLEDD